MPQGLVFENPTVDSRNIMQQRTQFYADCAGTLNRSCLTLYDVIHYNDVISALNLYMFKKICVLSVYKF